MPVSIASYFVNPLPVQIKRKVQEIQQMPLTKEEISNLRITQIGCLLSTALGAFFGQKLYSMAKIQSHHAYFRANFIICSSLTFASIGCSLGSAFLRNFVNEGNLSRQMQLLQNQLESAANFNDKSALFQVFK